MTLRHRSISRGGKVDYPGQRRSERVSFLGSQSVNQETYRIVNTSLLLFLVEVPNSDVCHVENRKAITQTNQKNVS
jgi:hypothetical protein